MRVKNARSKKITPACVGPLPRMFLAARDCCALDIVKQGLCRFLLQHLHYPHLIRNTRGMVCRSVRSAARGLTSGGWVAA